MPIRLRIPLLAALVATGLMAFPGEPAPAIHADDLSGRPFALATLKGKIVLLDFWASWCAPCKKSLPALDKLQEKYRDKGLEVVGISLDEDTDAISTFLERAPVKFRILRDPSGKSAEAFSVVAMPTSFLLDAEGRIAARYEGGDSLAAEEAAIMKLLQGAAATTPVDKRLAVGLQATGTLKAWRRGHLADPIMNLDGDPLGSMMREHIHSSKEAASGNGGASGGGCGCN
jgi:thiol-disulfide isomerase/thioredoxin